MSRSASRVHSSAARCAPRERQMVVETALILRRRSRLPAWCDRSHDRLVLFIEALAVEAQIAVHDHERRAPQMIETGIEVGIARPDCDQIGSTVDYERIAGIISSVVNSRHYDLVETLAAAIAKAVLALDRIDVALKLSKLQAIASARGAGVVLPPI